MNDLDFARAGQVRIFFYLPIGGWSLLEECANARGAPRQTHSTRHISILFLTVQ